MPSIADITARPIGLAMLLRGIADGAIVLPDFQRDFLWSHADAVSLFATVFAGWPSGSLLLMRGSPAFFTTREFEGAPRRATTVDYVVLDGQQRLTALYHALAGAGPVVYAVSIDAAQSPLPNAEQLEEAITVVRREVWDRDYPLAHQYESDLIPLYVLVSAPDYFEWRDRVVAELAPPDREQAADRLARAYKNVLGTVNSYEFPAVILENDLPPEAVARIFERINRTGLRLSVFDLLVARAYSPEWNLRDKWEEARRDGNHIGHFLGDDGLPILQAIALRDKSDIRQGALLQLDRARIHDDWESSVERTDRALDFLVSIGVRNPDWLPYRQLVLPLAALAADHDLEENRDVLESWFWARALAGEYDVASSTKVAADYRLLQEVLRGEAVVPPTTVPRMTLQEGTRRRQSAQWRAFLTLLVRSSAVDPLRGARLQLGVGDQGEEAVVTSIYPRERGDERHLRIMAQVLTTRTTARALQRTPLGAALDDEDTAHGDLFLASQFLPGADESRSLYADPERLFAWRYEMVEDYLVSEGLARFLEFDGA